MARISDKPICTFCGKEFPRIAVSASGNPDVCICPDCIQNAYFSIANGPFADLLNHTDKASTTSKKRAPRKKNLRPSQIYAELDKYIVGQDQAKKALSVAVYNHRKRLTDTTGLIKKSNILMVGSSGTGKTLLAKTLAKILDVPFAIADATSLTEAGYVGDDVENILTRLLMAADGNVSQAEQGIIFIDEIDKIARKSESPSITRDVSGEGVQHALLKIIEGAEVSVPLSGGRKHPGGDNVMINTNNILFICGGAFEGMLKETEKPHALGFGTPTDAEPVTPKLSPELLRSYGMTPELLGRLPVLIQLQDLTRDDLCHILTEPKDAITREYARLFGKDDILLEFTPDAIEHVADLAIERGVGARGIRSILENVFLDIMFTAPDDKTIGKLVITKDTIDHGEPEIVRKRIIA